MFANPLRYPHAVQCAVGAVLVVLGFVSSTRRERARDPWAPDVPYPDAGGAVWWYYLAAAVIALVAVDVVVQARTFSRLRDDTEWSQKTALRLLLVLAMALCGGLMVVGFFGNVDHAAGAGSFLLFQAALSGMAQGAFRGHGLPLRSAFGGGYFAGLAAALLGVAGGLVLDESTGPVPGVVAIGAAAVGWVAWFVGVQRFMRAGQAPEVTSAS